MKDRIIQALMRWNITLPLFLFNRHPYPYPDRRKLVPLPLLYLRSLFHKNEFKDVETFCMFIGCPKSGTSLLGSLLDAHPDIIIAHEVNVLALIRYGIFRRNQIFSILLRQSRSIERRAWNGYAYDIPSQWQGKYRTLRVIGDKKAGAIEALSRYPFLVGKLKKILNIRIKYIHLIRNPYDSTVKKTHKSRENLINDVEYFFRLFSIVETIKTQIDKEDIFEGHYEDLVNNPRAYLRRLCNFLGVGCTADYLEDCEKIIFKKPKRNPSDKWDDELIDAVKKKMGKFEYLKRYSYSESENRICNHADMQPA